MRSYPIQCPFCGFDYSANQRGCPWDCTTPRWRRSTATNRSWGPSGGDAWGDDHEDEFDRAAAWVRDLVDDDDWDADPYGPAREEMDEDARRPPGGDGARGAPAYELDIEGAFEGPRVYELPADGIDAAVSPTLCEAPGDDGEETADSKACECSCGGNAGDSRAGAASGRKDDVGPEIPELAGSSERGAPRARGLADGQGTFARAERVRRWGSEEDFSWERSSARMSSRSSRPQMRISRRGGDQEPFLWEGEGMGDVDDWSWAPWAADVGGSSEGAHDDVTLVFSVAFSSRR
ncbi:hypothetical protein RB597_005368 [Gaeumannomyces tritici]